MSAQSPICRLPTELISHIFVECDSFQSVLSFAATCRSFQVIWLRDYAQIYRAVASQSIPCYKSAEDLLNVQLEEQEQKAPTPQGSSEDQESLQRTIHKAKKLLENAKIVKNFDLIFATQIHPWDPESTFSMSTSEHERLSSHFYQLWILSSLEDLEPRISKMSMRDLYVLSDLGIWIGNRCSTPFFGKTGPSVEGILIALVVMLAAWDRRVEESGHFTYGRPVFADDIKYDTAITMLDEWWSRFSHEIPNDI